MIVNSSIWSFPDSCCEPSIVRLGSPMACLTLLSTAQISHALCSLLKRWLLNLAILAQLSYLSAAQFGGRSTVAIGNLPSWSSHYVHIYCLRSTVLFFVIVLDIISTSRSNCFCLPRSPSACIQFQIRLHFIDSAKAQAPTRATVAKPS